MRLALQVAGCVLLSASLVSAVAFVPGDAFEMWTAVAALLIGLFFTGFCFALAEAIRRPRWDYRYQPQVPKYRPPQLHEHIHQSDDEDGKVLLFGSRSLR